MQEFKFTVYSLSFVLKYLQQLDYTSNVIDNGLFVGMTTKMHLRQLFDDGDISEVQQNTFYESVHAFYVRAMEYATRNLPLNDELLKNARFLDFHSRESASILQVEYFVNR